ncbi:MAG: glutamate--tRNA ligase [Candidatus Woesebacteria bacterium]|jgi:glutamyl-tRNA synthetase
MTQVRTRFAPSPTGFLHVGGIRTALFAWLVARQNGGQFILRIEDTDKVREVEGSIQHIADSLSWLGIDWDEGVGVGGQHGPYIQSERLSIYKEFAQKLIDKGRAYADPYSAEELQVFRDKAVAEKRPFLFRDHRPKNPPTWDGTMPLRFKSDPKSYEWHDVIMGDLQTGPEVIDDFILLKSDGFPTYNFCHIVDDYLMKCTHIIRSQEFIASVPKFLNLYEALEITPPIMATAPPIMRADGKKKLGKRDGAKDVLDYAREGYLPDAMLNFIASMGWNDGTEQEIFSRQELIDKFSLDRVQKSGAKFDEQRLLWMNGTYIRALSIDDLYNLSKDYLPDSAKDFDDNYKKSVLGLIQERLKILSEIPQLTNFFFEDLPVNPQLIDDHKQLKKFDKSELKHLLEEAKQSLQQSDFTVADLTQRLNYLLAKTQQKPAVLFSLVRIATTQAAASPGLADSMVVIGKDACLKRINAQIESLS